MIQSKRARDREFYLRMAVRECWGKRELERQYRQALCERTVLRAVVEYALSRSLSPALIAEYQIQLLDKKLLAAKLHDFYLLKASPTSPDDDTHSQSQADSRQQIVTTLGLLVYLSYKALYTGGCNHCARPKISLRPA